MLGPLVLALLALGASGSTVGPKPKPFRDLGKWLDRCQEATLKDVGPEKIERALKVRRMTSGVTRAKGQETVGF